VEYIISSNGRPIGTTELDFLRFLEPNRSGWFHPNELGETLMPSIALLLPAMRAFVCRELRDADGRHVVQESFRNSSLFADLAEAFHRIETMQLTLHHPDGTLIPTAQIGIQDTHQLLELSRWNDPCQEVDPAFDALEWNESLEEELAEELELPAGGWEPSDDEDDFDFDEPWEADLEPVEFPRYQIHIELVNASAIP